MKHDFSAASDEYQNAVELAERFHLGDAHLAESLEGLAAARSRADESADIGPLFARAREIRDKLLAEKEASLGSDHLEIAECLDRCAFHRLMQKKPSEAIALHQRAFEIRKNALGAMMVSALATSKCNSHVLFNVILNIFFQLAYVLLGFFNHHGQGFGIVYITGVGCYQKLVFRIAHGLDIIPHFHTVSLKDHGF